MDSGCLMLNLTAFLCDEIRSAATLKGVALKKAEFQSMVESQLGNSIGSLSNESPSNRLLCEAIAQRIAQSPNQRISFAEFMELALYHPEQGYYATNHANIGAGGDFFTSPHLGRDFGELLAEQFVDMWQQMGCPDPFTLVEMGAGQGLLVQDIVRYLHRHQFEMFEALHYIIIERSPALRAEQQQRFAKLTQSWGRLSWQAWDEIPSGSIVGCCFSNELVDAFPVHQVCKHSGELQEIYVTVNSTDQEAKPTTENYQFIEQVGDLSTPQLREYFDWVGVDLFTDYYPDGYRTEVNLAALDWLATVADRLQRGYVLTIDYGYRADRYYSPVRSQGTLQCYYQHAHHSDPYAYVGRQDITAHADFTALERKGEDCGLTTIGFTQQGLFLLALGLGDRIAQLSDATVNEEQSLNDILRRRDALHSLANPLGLGNFGVLVQAKGLANTDALHPLQLRGLQAP